MNEAVFAPGDRLLFKRGTQYTGQLRPQGSEQTGQPIVIADYGTGARPRIDGQGVLDTILRRNVEHGHIRGLEVTNLGLDRQPGRTGVRVVVDEYGPMRGIHLTDISRRAGNSSARRDY